MSFPLSRSDIISIHLICLQGVWVVEPDLSQEDLELYGTQNVTDYAHELQNSQPDLHTFTNDEHAVQRRRGHGRRRRYRRSLVDDRDEDVLQELYEKRKRAYLNSKRLKAVGVAWIGLSKL